MFEYFVPFYPLPACIALFGAAVLILLRPYDAMQPFDMLRQTLASGCVGVLTMCVAGTVTNYLHSESLPGSVQEWTVLIGGTIAFLSLLRAYTITKYHLHVFVGWICGIGVHVIIGGLA